MKRLLFLGLILLLAGCKNIGRTTFTPDGKYIVTTLQIDAKKSGIYVTDTTDRDFAQLTYPVAGEVIVDAAVSSDGFKIAYSRVLDNQSRIRKLAHIFVMDRDGKNKRQITAGTVADNAPLFSPDSQIVYFLRDEDPLNPDEYGFTPLKIYSIKLDGTDLRQITKDAYSNLNGFSVSNDGKVLVYVGNKFESKEPPEFYKMLRVINLETLEEVERYKLDVGNYEPWPSSAGEGPQSFIFDPVFSPDDKSVAFVAYSKVRNKNDTTHDVFLYDTETQTTRKVANVGSHYVRWPSFSPSGQELVFCSGFPYACNALWKVHLDGSDLKKIIE